MLTGPILAEVTRRDTRTGRAHVESVHTGHLVVARADGTTVLHLGADDAAILPRSAVKPFQAAASLAVLREAASAGVALSGEELAVAWASHRGEATQLAVVRRLLERAGRTPEQLTCPPAAAEATPGSVPSRLQHNCSGKHAMFALAGGAIGCTGPALLDPDGPLQREVLSGLSGWLGPLMGVAVDGCGAPAPVVSLAGLAGGFAALAVDEELRVVREAGLAHPGLVGGRGRLETALLAAGVVAKVGAEGVYGVGFTAADGTPAGLAIKAADGSARGVAAVVAGVLEQAGIVPSGTWAPPAPLGGGLPVGEVRVTTAVDELAGGLAAWVAGGLR